MAGIIETFLSDPIKHCFNLVQKPEYFNYHRLVTQLRFKPRYSQFSVHLHGWRLSLPDAASFLSTYKAIFLDQIYAFAFEGNSPRILDLGANVGLSVLFFKLIYPKAKISAFEPDPVIFSYLEHNIRGNGYQDVELFKKAAWIEDTQLQFKSDGADAGHLVSEGKTGNVQVEAIDLDCFLRERKYDFIKMDIEGAEKVVLPACRDYLEDLRYLFVEFHSCLEEKQGLADIINLLADSGFRFSLQRVWGSSTPLLRQEVNRNGFDSQLNIHAWHE